MVSNFLNNSSPQLEKNEKILTILKEHQKTTLYACNFLESNKIKKNGLEATSKIGILCDKVGSGKSLSILSLIAHNPILEEDRYMCIKTTKNSMVSIFKGTSLNDFDYLKINVIVVPHSIASQWINYIKNDTKIKFTTINSKKTFNSLLECNDSVSPSFSNSHKINIKYKLEQYDVLLVISTKYKQTSEYLNNFGFTVSRLIFDEADSINIPSCKPIKNIMLWFVTSNRKTILNPRGSILYQNPETGQLNSWYSYSNNFTQRVQEQGIRCRGFIKDACESLFEIPEDIRELLFISNENEFIKQSFLLEEPHLYTIICKDPPMLSVLNNIVSNTTMDHIKAGDIEGAILTINCTKIDGKNLINLVTEDLKTELHNKFIEYESKSKMIYSSEKIKKESLDKIKDKIKDLENKMSQINKKISDDDTCPICYDNIENVTLCKHCNNKFCLKCITSWMMSQTQCKCPYCRGIITNESLILVTDNIEKKTDKEKLKSKNENVKIILEKIGNNSKILIFSKYDGSFSEISEMCNNNSIKYDKIMGSSVKIDNTIKKFNLPNSDPNSIDVLLLNSRYCGSGLNLQNATDIIIYHNMEQDLMNQIIGRAQRPGRTNKLNIWSLCYSNESNNSNILSNF